MKKRKVLTLIGDVVGMVLCLFIFVTPFLYMFLNSIKNKKEANLMSLALPTEIHFENYLEVFERDLQEAEKDIIISSPQMNRKKVYRMISLLKERQEAGVKVTIVT